MMDAFNNYIYSFRTPISYDNKRFNLRCTPYAEPMVLLAAVYLCFYVIHIRLRTHAVLILATAADNGDRFI